MAESPEVFIDTPGDPGKRNEYVDVEGMWFAGFISREGAGERLAAIDEEGGFLVRESQSRPNEYSLSVQYDQMVQHLRIRHESNRFALAADQHFDTIPALVRHYQYQSLGTNFSKLQTKLVLPCGTMKWKERSTGKSPRASIPNVTVDAEGPHHRSSLPHIESTRMDSQVSVDEPIAVPPAVLDLLAEGTRRSVFRARLVLTQLLNKAAEDVECELDKTIIEARRALYGFKCLLSQPQLSDQDFDAAARLYKSCKELQRKIVTQTAEQDGHIDVERVIKVLDEMSNLMSLYSQKID